MPESDERTRHILASLQERAKELNCLYAVDEILSIRDASVGDVAPKLIEAIPAGWQYPAVCRARLRVDGTVYMPDEFVETPWWQGADLVVEGERVGDIMVFYTDKRGDSDEGPFLKEERRLINAIAERVSFFLLQQKLLSARAGFGDADDISWQEHPDWMVILNFIRKTDQRLLARITRKMINHLCWNRRQAMRESLLQEFLTEAPGAGQVGENRPLQRRDLAGLQFGDRPYVQCRR